MFVPPINFFSSNNEVQTIVLMILPLTLIIATFYFQRNAIRNKIMFQVRLSIRGNFALPCVSGPTSENRSRGDAVFFGKLQYPTATDLHGGISRVCASDDSNVHPISDGPGRHRHHASPDFVRIIFPQKTKLPRICFARAESPIPSW